MLAYARFCMSILNMKLSKLGENSVLSVCFAVHLGSMHLRSSVVVQAITAGIGNSSKVL